MDERGDLAVAAAGIMLRNHPEDDASHVQYRNGADLLLETAGVTEDDPAVQRWIAGGHEAAVPEACTALRRRPLLITSQPAQGR